VEPRDRRWPCTTPLTPRESPPCHRSIVLPIPPDRPPYGFAFPAGTISFVRSIFFRIPLTHDLLPLPTTPDFPTEPDFMERPSHRCFKARQERLTGRNLTPPPHSKITYAPLASKSCPKIPEVRRSPLRIRPRRSNIRVTRHTSLPKP